MSKLFLVRHAEPARAGVLLGRADPPLSEAGRRAARETLAGLKVAVVYASPLRRSRETAAAVPARLVVLAELAEISLGEWDGLRWDEIERRDPELARRKTEGWFGVTPPGGEEWDHFAARVTRALERIRRGPLPAAVVGHVAVNAVLAQALTGRDPAGFVQEYCEIEEFEVDPATKD